MKRLASAAILAAGVSMACASPSSAAVYSPASPLSAANAGSQLWTPAQYWRGPGPRFYGPGPGPRFYGPGRRAYFYRPWYRRPYYGTIIGGIALGTIIGVTAYGLAPRPPRPDLCWYWADRAQSRGYWDYC